MQVKLTGRVVVLPAGRGLVFDVHSHAYHGSITMTNCTQADSTASKRKKVEELRKGCVRTNRWPTSGGAFNDH
ncbi:hypothetical protein Q8A67_018146 [Cirrhinus molitorella]|uniref:Uncharacterized protein n=1 Tax=Cirrhinus molitorella TaxID=172907 RepID=A0AA88PMZ2_9TELE|nr:hypothetical protein Q8A67_018146 [Cirrhinus molitorella]